MANEHKYIFDTYTSNDVIKERQTGINFFNAGTNDVTINNYLLPAGSELELSNDDGSIDCTQYTFFFIETGGTSRMDVIRRVQIT